MTLTEIPLSIAYVDSLRGRAYINAFLEKGLRPKGIVTIGGNQPFPDSFEAEAEKYGYASKYFNPYVDISQLTTQNSTFIETEASSINDPEVQAGLAKCDSDYVLYTAGGIVSEQTLEASKPFIHIHPGVVPEYRGSTCFYYSLLEKAEVGATAFIMAKGLDEGPIILQKKFKINIPLAEDQGHIFDYIVDQYIRMNTLSDVLQLFKDAHDIESFARSQNKGSLAPCYVMHPVLRRLCWEKVQAAYDPLNPKGIIAQPAL